MIFPPLTEEPKRPLLKASARRVGWIPLGDVLADKHFNVRHECHFAIHTFTANALKPPQVLDNSVAALAASIEERGQDTPIVVRTNLDERTRKKYPYALVAGHMRFEAMTLIVERARLNHVKNPFQKHTPEWEVQNPTIFAEIREMSDDDATLLNLTENAARKDLTTADLAYGVHRLAQMFRKKHGSDYGAAKEIAVAIGKGEGYTKQIITAMLHLSPEISDHWRVSMAPLSFGAIEGISRMPKSQQMGEYERLCKGEAPQKAVYAPDCQNPIKLGSFARTQKNMEEACELLGGLAAMGYISADGCGDFTDRKLLGMIVPLSREILTDIDRMQKISLSAAQGFERGFSLTMNQVTPWNTQE